MLSAYQAFQEISQWVGNLPKDSNLMSPKKYWLALRARGVLSFLLREQPVTFPHDPIKPGNVSFASQLTLITGRSPRPQSLSEARGHMLGSTHPFYESHTEIIHSVTLTRGAEGKPDLLEDF